MSTALQLAPRVGVGLACSALGVARATFYRVLQAPQGRAESGTMKTPSPMDARVLTRGTYPP
ncbi:MAG: hypothetical protein ACREWE_12405 [Gammaproteobacteria bacterium]